MWCHERNRLQPTPFWCAVVLGAFVHLGSAAAATPPPTLRVSGKASLTTDARSRGDGYEVHATLSDEVGRPIVSAEVRARAASASSTPALSRCADSRIGGGELLLSTDKAGRFCVVVSGMQTGTLELNYQDPRGYFERTSRVVSLPESTASSFELGFDPPLSTLPLDQPVQELGIVARATSTAQLPASAELAVSLIADGHERELGRAALESLGEVQRLALVSASFGQPGPARLVARLRSREGSELARVTAPVLRTATIALRLESNDVAQLEPGATLKVRAASLLGPAPSGVAEAKRAGASITVAPVSRGAAVLSLPSALPEGMLTLEYVGAGPGWLPGPPLELRVGPPSPSYARSALWVVAALLAALAVVLGWRRPPRPLVAPQAPPVRSRASVEVLETFGPGGGYRGRVRDAHDGTPVSPALITILTSGAQGRVLAEVRAHADGAFELTHPASFPEGAIIEVNAPLHSTLRAPLPVPGVIELSLISRRRALLDRLVRWAERRGKPWTRAASEPTPAQVVEVAVAEGEPGVERWAREIEHLAFGPTPPDGAHERVAGVSEDPKLGRDQ